MSKYLLNLNHKQQYQHIKRTFDILLSFITLILFGGIIIFLILLAFIDCGGNGLFLQKRIGQYGKSFKIYKIRTMHLKSEEVSAYGRILRKYKLDELPQLLNILWGQMSFVGPRPDVPGYYDTLQGEARKLLQLKPGLCSRAALKYFDEEQLLDQKAHPLLYNDQIIFPDKIRINLEYLQNVSLREDLSILLASGIHIVRQTFQKNKNI